VVVTEAIAALLTIIGVLLAHFLKEKPPGLRHEDKIREMDRAIADNDAATISRLFEQLRSESGSDTSGQGGKAPPVGQLRSDAGMAEGAIRSGTPAEGVSKEIGYEREDKPNEKV